MIGIAVDAASLVAEKRYELADEHYDNSFLNTALLLGADLNDFQGEKIDFKSKELELLGLENDKVCAQIARVKDLVFGKRKILDAMPEYDRALFEAFQVFILDVFYASGARRIQWAPPHCQRLNPSQPLSRVTLRCQTPQCLTRKRCCC